MPVLKSRLVFEITRGIKAFLNLDAGLAHGEAPDFERMFKQARGQAERYRRQLERTRKQLSDKNRELDQARRRLENKSQRGAGQRSQPTTPRDGKGKSEDTSKVNRETPLAGPTPDEFGVAGGLDTGLPLPPHDLLMRVGGPPGQAFDTLGAKLAADLSKAFPSDFSWQDARVLDFGCGIGRVLRHFVDYANQWHEFWGCDIHEESISWLEANLSPPFRFVKTSETPPLPFESDYFDLIYGISVFTHLTEEQWAGWLEELRRVTRPGGTVILTYHNRVAYERRFNRPFREEAVGLEVHGHDIDWDRGGPRAYHSDWWIRENWGEYFAIERLVDHGLQNWQSIAVMRKGGAAHDGSQCSRRIDRSPEQGGR